MANTISKISNNSPLTTLNETDFSSPARSGVVEEGSRSFIEVLIDANRDLPALGRGLHPQQHQVARRLVFHNLVQSTLDDPQHPYSRLDAELKQDMVDAITEELVHSHYKT